MGADAQTLKRAAQWMIAQLAFFEEVSGLEDNQPYDKNELILELTPRGETLGFTVETIGAELYARLNGVEAVAFPDGGRTAKIIVSLSEDNIKADFLNKTHLRSSKGKYVKLSDIVSVESKFGFATITRDNGQRKIVLSGDISEDDPKRATFVSNEIKNSFY